MIPDKMIIGRGNDGRIRHSYWTTDQELTAFEDTVFIRKDALMEWLQQGFDWAKNPVISVQQIIDKLNSL